MVPQHQLHGVGIEIILFFKIWFFILHNIVIKKRHGNNKRYETETVAINNVE